MSPARTRTLLIFAALIVFPGVPLWAQSDPTTISSSSDSCLHRSIPLTMFSHAQQAPPEVRQVQVFVNGTQISASSLALYSGPVRVLLLIDTSGSMQSSPQGEKWGPGFATAAFAVDSIPSRAAVIVGTFAQDLQLSQWQDRDSASKQVLTMKQRYPKGRTALYSALDKATSGLGNAQFLDTVFLVTDGGDNFRTVKPQQVVESLAARGIRVFVFLVDSGEYKTPEEREAPENMEGLASATGGIVFRPPWSKEWITGGGAREMAKQIQHAAASPYRVDFRLTAPINKSAKLKLETSLDPKLFTLAYPRHLEPCIAVAPPN